MKTLLDAVKETGAGDSIKLTSPQANHGIEILFGGLGTITSCTIDLEGGISGKIFQALSSYSCITTDFIAGGAISHIANKVVETIRANVTAYASGSKATSTLTGSALSASGDTITIDSKVYKFQTASLASEGYVVIGSTLATALQRLQAAINNDTTLSAYFNVAAAHSTVTADSLGATTITIMAKDYGTDGNSIGLASSTAATLVWSSATMTGGTEQGEVTVIYTPYPGLS